MLEPSLQTLLLQQCSAPASVNQLHRAMDAKPQGTRKKLPAATEVAEGQTAQLMAQLCCLWRKEGGTNHNPWPLPLASSLLYIQRSFHPLPIFSKQASLLH
jgi:hypothetical protein